MNGDGKKERTDTMKKPLSLLIMLAMLLSLAVPACAEGNERPGAKWINSDIYGAFEGLGEIRPQDDFAAAVNRAWSESARIPDGQDYTSARLEHDLENIALKIALLHGEQTDDPELTAMQTFFAQFLDWDTRNQIGYQELKPYADDIMSISGIDELTAFFSDPKRNLYQYGPMIEGMVTPDDDDVFTNIMSICSPAMLSTTDSSFYTDEEDGAMRATYRRLCGYMLTRLGYSEEEAEELFNLCVAFEKNFAPAVDEYMQRMMREGEALARHNPMTVEEMETLYRNIPIRQICKGLGYELEGRVNEFMPSALRMYDTLYTAEHLEELKAWTLIHTVLLFQDYVDRDTFVFIAGLSGNKASVESQTVYEQSVLKTIYTLIPGMIDKLYAEYCFDPKIKEQLTELTQMMIDAYRVMLTEEVDWLSEETKAAAIEKLDSIKLHICYPDVMPDFTDVRALTMEEGGSLMKTYVSILQHKRKADAETLARKNDGSVWHYSVNYSELGACYLPYENSINIQAGICGGEFYDPSWPIEKRLGGVCMVVGHEISHAFDTNGADYDKDGNRKDWWKPEDRQAFQKRVDKLEAYYSRIIPAPQLSDRAYGENGAHFIRAEAIADLASMKCLLSIAKKMEGFDYNLFFTQIARIQKAARSEAAERKYLATDNHPVDCFRCNIPVQNYDEFLETYGVQEGDGMYLAPEDRIRVW